MTLNTGWNFISLPNIDIICDETIRSILTNICNQTYSINQLFNNPNIEHIFRYIGSSWAYWDNNTSLNNAYNLNKFTTISSLEGLAIKVKATTQITIPKLLQNKQNDFVSLQKKGWYLVGVKEDTSISDLENIISLQGKALHYVWVYRGGTWYAKRTVNSNSFIDGSIPVVNTLFRGESFWIYIE